MSIVGAFPSTIQNGTLEDATQVMALFAYIQSQVNGNACPATSTSSILKGNGSGGTAPAVAGTDYQAVLPAGTVFDYAGGSVPTGFLACDGSAVSRTTFAALFAAISTTWGAGDGSTTFNVPDMRRRTTIGSGGSAIAGPANTVGAVGGEEKHTLTTAELAGHIHPIIDPTHNHTVTNGAHSHTIAGGQTARLLLPFVGGGGTYGAGTASTGDVTGTDAAASNVSLASAATGITVGFAGSDAAHNNMQPSAVVTKMIKT